VDVSQPGNVAYSTSISSAISIVTKKIRTYLDRENLDKGLTWKTLQLNSIVFVGYRYFDFSQFIEYVEFC
jgi:hypothetical protein